MKLAIMQPYLFPYIGYFQLINASDRWIVFDTVQYIRHGWLNRNRILNPKDGWQYIIVPLKKHKRGTPINEVDISDSIDWKGRIIRQLEHYKKKAPFYKDVISFLQDCFDIDIKSISSLNVHLLEKTCDYLNIPFSYEIFSEMKLEIGKVEHPGEWALKISQAMGAKDYINLPGGIELFDKRKFNKAGIQLKFLVPNYNNYDQGRKDFQSGLSIIDVMMFNPKEEIQKFLNKYQLL